MVVFFITMIKRIRANAKGQQNHTHFKNSIMNNIDTKQRQAAQKERQQGTMNRTGQ